MTDHEALAILEDALHRCGNQDMRTADVAAALAQLEPRALEPWPFAQFRHALSIPLDAPAAATGRPQVVNASLNAIRRVCRLM